MPEEPAYQRPPSHVAAQPRGVSRPPIGRLRARAKLAGGVPLLHDEPITIDLVWALAEVGAALAATAASEPQAARDLHALTRLDVARLVEEAFVGHRDHLAQLMRPAGESAEPLQHALSVAGDTLLGRVSRDVQPLLELAEWGRPYCPVCGATGLSSEATLACPRCGAAWHAAAQPDHSGFRIELGHADAREDQEWRDD